MGRNYSLVPFVNNNNNNNDNNNTRVDYTITSYQLQSHVYSCFYLHYKENFKWECSYDWEMDNYVKTSYLLKRITESIPWTVCHYNGYCNHNIKIVRYYHLYFIVSFNKPNPFINTLVKHCEQIRHITYTAHITWMRIVHISNVGVDYFYGHIVSTQQALSTSSLF